MAALTLLRFGCAKAAASQVAVASGPWLRLRMRRFSRPLYTTGRRFQLPVDTVALPTFSEPALGTAASPPRDGELRSGMYRPKVIQGPERRRAW